MQDFQIKIAGSDDNAFSCGADDTVLSAALRSGKGFPYECNSGGCGSCQFELVEGEVKDLWDSAPGLSEKAKERGRHLACQCVPSSDCTIKVRFDDKNAPVVAPKRHMVTFVEARPVTSDMSEFVFRAEEKAEFVAGQFAMLGLPGIEGLRAYSMCNLANEAGEWRFVIKRVPKGKGTAVLFESLKPGDKLTIDGPYGNSYLRTDNGRDIVCIAGGSGLSPVLSILRGAVQAPGLAGRKLHVFYGGRGPADICVPDIVAADPVLSERVTVHTAISDTNAPGADQWTGDTGFIHDLVKKVLGDDMPQYDYYFCGPPPMTDAVQRMLMLDYKVPGSQLFFDRFF